MNISNIENIINIEGDLIYPVTGGDAIACNLTKA
jgi:hypothetical protein